MTVSNDGELVGHYLIIMCIPQVLMCCAYLIGAGGLMMSQADVDILWFMLLPILGVYAVAFSAMAVGHWTDSGGLDV